MIFTVTDDGSGALTVTRDPAEGASFTFTNAYTVDELSSSVTDQIAISKDLTGKAACAGRLAPSCSPSSSMTERARACRVLTATNGADGRIVFPALTYTEPASTYRLAEVVDENVGGIEFDKAVYTVRTTVVDNGDGTLSATHEVFDENGARSMRWCSRTPTIPWASPCRLRHSRC